MADASLVVKWGGGRGVAGSLRCCSFILTTFRSSVLVAFVSCPGDYEAALGGKGRETPFEGRARTHHSDPRSKAEEQPSHLAEKVSTGCTSFYPQLGLCLLSSVQVLIGEPGVGKTAIAEGLAQKIVAGDIPELLQGSM